MFKKFNWGWGIALFYSTFVVFMLFMVWCTSLMTPDMVTEDYYGKELKFQNQLDKMKHSNVLSQPVKWIVENKSVKLSFPVDVRGKAVKAHILFYRPDNSKDDFNVSCNADSAGTSIVTSNKFIRGVYKMEIDWSADKETYYNEGVVNIN